MDKIRKRFIIFSFIVLSSILIAITLFILIGQFRGGGRHHGLDNDSFHRFWTTALVGTVLVFIGSWLLSKKAVRPIEEAWQKQLDFTADASHELRTPLTVIKTNLELVIDSPEETIKSQMKWLKNIAAEQERMTRLVADLLTLSRSDTNEQELEIEPFMLDEMVLKTVKSFEVVATKQEIEFETHTSGDVHFVGDKQRIEQLAIILIDNALKHMNRSGLITVTLNQDEKETTLIVADTGQGIESKHLDKIFDRFYRVKKTKTSTCDGSGLGLAIAKWIVEAHGGAITVASTLGVGMTFTITLPNHR